MDGDQLRRIHDAFLSAFDLDGLRQFLMYRLGWDLQAIAHDGDLNEVVFDVLDYARRQGRLVDLVGAARNECPLNEELRNIKIAIVPTGGGMGAGQVQHEFRDGNGVQYSIGRLEADVTQIRADVRELRDGQGALQKGQRQLTIALAVSIAINLILAVSMAQHVWLI